MNFFKSFHSKFDTLGSRLNSLSSFTRTFTRATVDMLLDSRSLHHARMKDTKVRIHLRKSTVGSILVLMNTSEIFSLTLCGCE